MNFLEESVTYTHSWLARPPFGVRKRKAPSPKAHVAAAPSSYRQHNPSPFAMVPSIRYIAQTPRNSLSRYAMKCSVVQPSRRANAELDEDFQLCRGNRESPLICGSSYPRYHESGGPYVYRLTPPPWPPRKCSRRPKKLTPPPPPSRKKSSVLLRSTDTAPREQIKRIGDTAVVTSRRNQLN